MFLTMKVASFVLILVGMVDARASSKTDDIDFNTHNIRSDFHPSKFQDVSEIPPNNNHPGAPNINNFPNIPNINNLPNIPNINNFPNIPNINNLPNIPNINNLPNIPNINNFPNRPNINTFPNRPNNKQHQGEYNELPKNTWLVTSGSSRSKMATLFVIMICSVFQLL